MILWRGLGTATTSTSSFTSLISSLAPSFDVPTNLALALVAQESGTPGQLGTGSATAVSSAGAQGLFQVMPSNDASLGITDPFDPTQSATGGLSLLQQYYNEFGNWTEALEAYNEGPAALQAQLNAGQTPTSQGYADSILAAAGMTSSTSDSTDSSDLSDSSLSDTSDDSDILDSLSDSTGVSSTILLGGAALLVGLAVALSA